MATEIIIIALRAATASDRLEELQVKLDDGSITVVEVDEVVDLMAVLGMTLSGEQPARFKSQTRH
jgi:hypothetical protein